MKDFDIVTTKNKKKRVSINLLTNRITLEIPENETCTPEDIKRANEICKSWKEKLL